MKHLNNSESCFVCRRRACGLGVGKDRRIGWTCQICADEGLGLKAYKMDPANFDTYEQAALVLAGNAAGAYLDRLGRTDLAALHPEEWQEFCRRLVQAFGYAIQDQIRMARPTMGGR
ncbi:hypothetical protein SB2_06935 [Methylobacterium radiotolerans]|nr:hypothetical protein SB3_08980 [Methylobacterium radiotolerans]KTS49277.1 hypothetical protein SB2_06935 [Methylobacterium radiotolerans]